MNLVCQRYRTHAKWGGRPSKSHTLQNMPSRTLSPRHSILETPLHKPGTQDPCKREVETPRRNVPTISSYTTSSLRHGDQDTLARGYIKRSYLVHCGWQVTTSVDRRRVEVWDGLAGGFFGASQGALRRPIRQQNITRMRLATMCTCTTRLALPCLPNTPAHTPLYRNALSGTGAPLPGTDASSSTTFPACQKRSHKHIHPRTCHHRPPLDLVGQAGLSAFHL